MSRLKIHRLLSFLPKYRKFKRNYRSSDSNAENVKIGTGAKDLRVFKIERTNSDMRGTNMLVGNQSGSTVTAGAGANSNAFGRLSFSKRPKKAIFK